MPQRGEGGLSDATVIKGITGVPGIQSVGAMAAQGFSAFFGRAGAGRPKHHIVEQNAGNIQRFGAEPSHVRPNMVSLPTGVHQQISGFYSSIRPFTNGQTVRQWLSGQSYQAQQKFGMEVLEQFGVGGL